MILSLLKLDLTSPSVRQSLKNCQDMHRNIMKAFDSARNDAKVLYRVLRSKENIRIYVQSMAEPHWERIENNGFICEKMKDISKLSDSFREGQVLSFDILGCPSKKVAGEGKNSKRVILREKEAQIGWIKREGEKNGFIILDAFVYGKTEILCGKRDTGTFQIAGLVFQGTLKITDPVSFQKGFMNGIGPEKAYGFGMMMVKRYNEY